MRKIGSYEKVGSVEHFIPDALPPRNPALHLSSELLDLFGQAMLRIGKLNEMINKLPDPKRFLKAYIIKEALLSSSIEGVHTTMLDVFTQPFLETRPNKDTQLVLNYTKALDEALRLIKYDNMPLANRVILRAHEVLMAVGEGDKADPGHFRKQNVRVGNLIPAPWQRVPDLMSSLEQFINQEKILPTLIDAGLAHVQFEMIHPFLDGNGRIGRLLIVLMLVENKLLSDPILYPSYYFKKHQVEYYHRLDRVRTHGDFEGWILFYLSVIKDSASDAYTRARNVESLQEHLIKVISEDVSRKVNETRMRSLDILFNQPVITINELATQLDVAYNTASQVITDFRQLNILVEETQQKRGKIFRFKSYLDALDEDLSI